MSTTAADLVKLLFQRGPLLARLVTAPTDVPTLTEEVSVSRSTVNRTLAAFEEWGLITTDADQLTPTQVAQVVITAYDDFEADVTGMVAHEVGDTPLWRTAGERTDALALVAERLDFLEYAQTSRDKRTLIAELPYARSTVDRVIRELEVAGFIQRKAAGYTTTPIGQRITVRYRTLLGTLSVILAARDLLAHLPADRALPPALFTTATIERTDPTIPYHLLTGVRDRLDTADHIRLVLSSLPNPQLLDVCHHRVVRQGATLELVADPSLTKTLTNELPGPLAEMVAATGGTVSVSVADTPPFGLVLATTEETTTVSVIIYGDRGTILGAIHTETTTAVQWAEECYSRAHRESRAVTDTLSDLTPVERASTTIGPSAGSDTDQVALETDGVVKLTPEYFAQRAPAPPVTGWRTGFDLVDIHAGYAIDRETEHDGTRHNLTTDLTARLTEGENLAVLGPPGSGKSTVCKSVACRWYEQGLGPVFYRESGRGTTLDSPAVLEGHLRTANGHALVVIEDAVRAEANAVFRLMKAFRGTETVTFLLDAREGEWADPDAFPIDANLDAYRTDAIETVAMPPLGEHDCERIVEHFQATTDQDVDVSTSYLLHGGDIGADDDTQTRASTSQPAELLLMLHRLTLRVDPLAGGDTRIPTTLTEDVHQTYAALRTDGDVVLNVGVIVNLLNAAGLDVEPALVYALAETDETVREIRATLESLEGHLIFRREAGSDDPSYRMVHEAWSELFLEHLLDIAGSPAASQRFGRCVSALLALADDTAQRERSAGAVRDIASVIDRIAAAPTEWADATTDSVFQLGLGRPGLARLFGTNDLSPIELPDACSPGMVPRCAVRRGRMYYEGGNYDQAERDFTDTIQRVETADASETAQLQRVKARSQKNVGAVAYRRGNLDTAVGFYTRARASYRDLSDRRGEADCYNNLGIISCARGNLDRAVAYYERSLIIAQDIDAPDYKQASYLNNLGHVALLRGDFDRAKIYLNRSLSLSYNINDSINMVSALHNLGVITQKRGDLTQAENYHNQTITISQDIGRRLGKREGLSGLGAIDIERGDLDQAAAHIQRSLDIDRAIGANRCKAMDQCYLGGIARKRCDYETAETHLTDALRLSREGNYRSEEAQTLVALGELARDRKRPERARERFSDAVEIYRDMGAVRDVIESLERLAEICEVLDEEETALTHYETAVDLVEATEFIEPHESLSDRCTTLTAQLDSDSHG
jgi:tetratricopeptide (TPR) repeat protein/predicted transcriptional regulator